MKIYHCETCGQHFDSAEELDADEYGFICPECSGLFVVTIERDEDES